MEMRKPSCWRLEGELGVEGGKGEESAGRLRGSVIGHLIFVSPTRQTSGNKLVRTLDNVHTLF